MMTRYILTRQRAVASVPKMVVKWQEPLLGNRDAGCNEQICHDLLTKTLRDLHARVGSINVSSAFSDWAIEYLRLSRNDNRVTDRPDPATNLLSFFSNRMSRCRSVTEVITE